MAVGRMPESYIENLRPPSVLGRAGPRWSLKVRRDRLVPAAEGCARGLLQALQSG